MSIEETRIQLTPKPHPSGKWASRRVTRKRAHYGEIRHYVSRIAGKKLNIYWAKRKTDEVFRADNSWAIDIDTINVIKAYGVQFVGIEVEDGTKLLTPITTFVAGTEGVHIRNYEKHVGAKHKLGARQFYVEERVWVVLRPPIEERELTLMERMSFKKARK